MLKSDTMCTASCAQSCRDLIINPGVGIQGKYAESYGRQKSSVKHKLSLKVI